jgi:EpsI family protein
MSALATSARPPIQRFVLGLLMLLSVFGSYALKPTERISESKPKIELEQQIPVAFGDWKVDTAVVPVLPNPELLASLNALYSSTLARTYRNSAGQRIMLSIAYGSDQSSESTAVHRPEFCYSAQGFKVSNLGQQTLAIGQRQLRVQQLLGVLGNRYEPITYWITLDETATLPGLDRKFAQLQYGLRNQLPDGLLFRVSTVGLPELESFTLQQKFLGELEGAMAPNIVSRYFGS